MTSKKIHDRALVEELVRRLLGPSNEAVDEMFEMLGFPAAPPAEEPKRQSGGQTDRQRYASPRSGTTKRKIGRSKLRNR
jgi:hypothetical protein